MLMPDIETHILMHLDHIEKSIAVVKLMEVAFGNLVKKQGILVTIDI